VPGGETQTQTKAATTSPLDSEPVTNRSLIAELTEEFRKVVPVEHYNKGDYAFVGRLYNDFGYDRVLVAINDLGYKVDAGQIPDNPLVYLRGIIQRNVNGTRADPVAPTVNLTRKELELPEEIMANLPEGVTIDHIRRDLPDGVTIDHIDTNINGTKIMYCLPLSKYPTLRAIYGRHYYY
jgi:hypothetical protein